MRFASCHGQSQQDGRGLGLTETFYETICCGGGNRTVQTGARPRWGKPKFATFQIHRATGGTRSSICQETRLVAVRLGQCPSCGKGIKLATCPYCALACVLPLQLRPPRISCETMLLRLILVGLAGVTFVEAAAAAPRSPTCCAAGSSPLCFRDSRCRSQTNDSNRAVLCVRIASPAAHARCLHIL